MMMLDQIIELDIEQLVSDGRGLGRKDGVVVFATDALPGQRVSVRIDKTQRNCAEGHVLEILMPSAHQRDEPCMHGEACGACPWSRLEYAQQLVWKERILDDALSRLGGVKPQERLPIMAAPQEWGYRNKMSFVFGEAEGGGVVLGLRHRRSHRVVDVLGCQMQDAFSMAVLARIRAFAKASGLSAYVGKAGFWRHVVLRRPRLGGCFVEVIVGRHPQGYRAALQLAETLSQDVLAFGVDGVVCSSRFAEAELAQGERVLYRCGQEQIRERLYRSLTNDVSSTTNVSSTAKMLSVNKESAMLKPPLTLAYNHSAFFQVNTAVAERLYVETAQHVDIDTNTVIWDMYCGVGSIGLFLAEGAMAVEGWEIAPEAVHNAVQNAHAAGFTHCRFHTGDAAKAFTAMKGQAFAGKDNLVVLDPPRAGLSQHVIQGLLAVKPQHILYISCNPATLARDLKRLSPAYSLKLARAADMFPQTPHLETLTLLQRC